MSKSFLGFLFFYIFIFVGMLFLIVLEDINIYIFFLEREDYILYCIYKIYIYFGIYNLVFLFFNFKLRNYLGIV